jgi:uncharacterized DUF497 family protein
MAPFEWDADKAESNFTKHRVTFAEAATAFADPHHRLIADPDHSASEERWLLLGVSAQARLLVVAHTERSDTIRIINARVATAHERRAHD